jgi:hypothetical protein
LCSSRVTRWFRVWRVEGEGRCVIVERKKVVDMAHMPHVVSTFGKGERRREKDERRKAKGKRAREEKHL